MFSDFKRHDVGAALADSKNFNQIAPNQFITPPLWGIRDSAPYLHDAARRRFLTRSCSMWVMPRKFATRTPR